TQIPGQSLNARAYRTGKSAHHVVRSIGDRDDDRRRLLFFFSTQFSACGPTNRRAFLFRFAFTLLPFLFLRFERVFEIPRHRGAKRRIVGSEKTLALKTLAAATERLRL